MTCIAYDGRFVASDTQAVRGSALVRSAPKIEGRPIDGHGWHVFATAGAYGPMRSAMIQWWIGGCNPYAVPPHNFADVRDLGQFAVISAKTRQCWMYSHQMPYLDEENVPWALGSGGDHAITAMRCDRTAMEAVALAALDDVGTNDDVRFIDLEHPEKGVQVWDRMRQNDTIAEPARQFG